MEQAYPVWDAIGAVPIRECTIKVKPSRPL